MTARKAMTLTELLLALVITSMIALAVVGVGSAVSAAQARSEGLAETLQAGRASMERIQRLARNARLVTACSEQVLVLWAQDVREPGRINLSEIVILRYDPATRQVTATQVEFPASMSEPIQAALDQTLSLSNVASVAGAASVIEHSPHRVTRVVADDVEAFRFLLSDEAPLSPAILMMVRFGQADQSVALPMTVVLRAHYCDRVSYANGQFVLLEP